MSTGKWKRTGAVIRLPIFYKVILANSAMAFAVIIALLTMHDMRLAAALIVIAAGVINALLVRAALTVDELRMQQRELFAWTLSRAEEERSRIARELHEDAAQRVAALALRSQAGEAISSEAAALAEDLAATAGTLQPPRMQLLGLAGAVEWYAQAVERRFGVPVHVHAHELEDLATPLGISIFRVIEDVIETLARNLPARIELDIAVRGDDVAASIRAYHSAVAADFTNAEHFRLSERAACLGGSLHIAQRADGTFVDITIPMREQQHA